MKIQSRQIFLLLTSLFVSSRAFSERQCGTPLKNNMEYDSMPSEGGGPWPSVARISKQNNREIIEVTYSYPAPNGREDVTRAVRSQNGGHTWQLDSEYRESGLLNSTTDSVVYKAKADDLLTRSEDRGIHWIDCRFNIDRLSSSQFAQKIAEGRRATLHFGLAAIHPRKSSIIYGSISVWVPSESDPKTQQETIDLPGIYVSHDSGDNWTLFAPDLRGYRPDEPTQLGIDPSDPNRMIGHGKLGMVMTTDGGKSWFPVGQQADLEKPVEIKGRRESIAEHKKWDKSDIPPYPAFAYLMIKQIAFQPETRGSIYLVTNKGLYNSQNDARSWSLLYAGRPSLFEIHSLVSDPSNAHRLFLGTRESILVSDDDGCHFRTLFDWREYSKMSSIRKPE